MTDIGYARVSTREQKDDSQVDALLAAGVAGGDIYVDKVTGKQASRPQLDKALARLKEGDVLVITRLSRAMRSLKHMLALTEELEARGVSLRVIKQDIDTTTSDRPPGLPHPGRHRRVAARADRGGHARGPGVSQRPGAATEAARVR